MVVYIEADIGNCYLECLRLCRSRGISLKGIPLNLADTIVGHLLRAHKHIKRTLGIAGNAGRFQLLCGHTLYRGVYFLQLSASVKEDSPLSHTERGNVRRANIGVLRRVGERGEHKE